MEKAALKMTNNIQIVLVRVENPANIGQTARAMKNFGLSRLHLVNCVPHRVQEAYTLGWNAKEIIDEALVFNSMEEAIKDSVLTVGFSRRSGHSRGEPRPFPEILPQILETASGHTVALVFGNEKNGLSNEELKFCHLATVLPTASEHGSLNLSHAVAVAGFLIFNQRPESNLNFKKPERFYATQEELFDLLADFKSLLEVLDYRDAKWNDLLTRTLNNLSRLFKRAGIERREFHLLKAFVARVRRKISMRTESPELEKFRSAP